MAGSGSVVLSAVGGSSTASSAVTPASLSVISVTVASVAGGDRIRDLFSGLAVQSSVSEGVAADSGSGRLGGASGAAVPAPSVDAPLASAACLDASPSVGSPMGVKGSAVGSPGGQGVRGPEGALAQVVLPVVPFSLPAASPLAASPAAASVASEAAPMSPLTPVSLASVRISEGPLSIPSMKSPSKLAIKSPPASGLANPPLDLVGSD